MLRRGLHLLVLALGLLWPLTRVATAQEDRSTPDLSAVAVGPNDCEFLLHGADDPRPLLGNIACGTLDVPENWDRPEGRRIRIGYLILKSTAAQPATDPVVFLAGGPGSSPLTLAATWAPFFAGLRHERDVVFFDQRGTRLSSPLRCEAYTKIMALDLPPAEQAAVAAGTPVPPAYPSELIDPDRFLRQAEATYGPIADACARQIAATGADLRQYTTAANANDAVALVKALGYDEYNLYGISYGTRLALEVLRNHPESGLRSVVLDSTVPPEVKSYERLSAGPHEAVIQLFADCERDPACNAAYPDLEARFVALLAKLRTDPVTGQDGTPITDRDLIRVMQSLTARVEIAPYLPLMIDELGRGEDRTYRGIVGGSLALAIYVPAAVATPESAGAAATPAAVAANLSPAREFVLDAQARFEAVPGHAASQFLQELRGLDAQSHDRRALQDFVDRAFPQPDQAEARAALRSAVEALTDPEVQAVFAVVEQTITLDDYRIAGQTVPQYYSIECNERAPYQSFANAVANAQRLEIPDLALGMPEEIVKVFAVCERWPSDRASETETQPVWSQIPTLILSGAYDNLTPVSWNRSAFETLPNGVFVLAPGSAHGVITYSACADRIAQTFIADPNKAPDTSCLAGLKPRWGLPPGSEPDREQATPAGGG
jgi:pimeloyl-ACP methyl ester carboxylesterase